MEAMMNIQSGKQYFTRRGERVTVLTIDPNGRFPTEATLTESTVEWPVVIRIESGRWQGLTSRLMLDGHAKQVAGQIVEHENDIVAEAGY